MLNDSSPGQYSNTTDWPVVDLPSFMNEQHMTWAGAGGWRQMLVHSPLIPMFINNSHNHHLLPLGRRGAEQGMPVARKTQGYAEWEVGCPAFFIEAWSNCAWNVHANYRPQITSKALGACAQHPGLWCKWGCQRFRWSEIMRSQLERAGKKAERECGGRVGRRVMMMMTMCENSMMPSA